MSATTEDTIATPAAYLHPSRSAQINTEGMKGTKPTPDTMPSTEARMRVGTAIAARLQRNARLPVIGGPKSHFVQEPMRVIRCSLVRLGTRRTEIVPTPLAA